MAEYKQARALNDRIRYIVEKLSEEYPHLNDKFKVILNTLNIFTPDDCPQLTEEGGDCIIEEESSENVAEKPLCP